MNIYTLIGGETTTKIRIENLKILETLYVENGIWADLKEINQLREGIEQMKSCIIGIWQIPDNDQNAAAKAVGQILVKEFPEYTE